RPARRLNGLIGRIRTGQAPSTRIVSRNRPSSVRPRSEAKYPGSSPGPAPNTGATSGPPSPSGVFGEYIEKGGGAMVGHSSGDAARGRTPTRVSGPAAGPAGAAARFPPGTRGPLH